MTEFIKQLRNRGSIRKYKQEPVDAGVMSQILEAATNSASSNGLQMSSLIHINDPKIKKRLSEIGTQPFIADIPELYLVIVDVYRNTRITSDAENEVVSASNLNNFFQAFIDGVIFAQNIVSAAESAGLGAVYLGSITREIGELIQMFKLPKYTFPIVGLGLGVPDENNGVKPKMEKQLRVFEDTYPVFDDYTLSIAGYDETMAKYYKERSNKNSSFTANVVGNFSKEYPDKKYLEHLKNQGFDI